MKKFLVVACFLSAMHGAIYAEVTLRSAAKFGGSGSALVGAAIVAVCSIRIKRLQRTINLLKMRSLKNSETIQKWKLQVALHEAENALETASFYRSIGWTALIGGGLAAGAGFLWPRDEEQPQGGAGSGSGSGGIQNTSFVLAKIDSNQGRRFACLAEYLQEAVVRQLKPMENVHKEKVEDLHVAFTKKGQLSTLVPSGYVRCIPNEGGVDSGFHAVHAALYYINNSKLLLSGASAQMVSDFRREIGKQHRQMVSEALLTCSTYKTISAYEEKSEPVASDVLLPVVNFLSTSAGSKFLFWYIAKKANPTWQKVFFVRLILHTFKDFRDLIRWMSPMLTEHIVQSAFIASFPTLPIQGFALSSDALFNWIFINASDTKKKEFLMCLVRQIFSPKPFSSFEDVCRRITCTPAIFKKVFKDVFYVKDVYPQVAVFLENRVLNNDFSLTEDDLIAFARVIKRPIVVWKKEPQGFNLLQICGKAFWSAHCSLHKCVNVLGTHHQWETLILHPQLSLPPSSSESKE